MIDSWKWDCGLGGARYGACCLKASGGAGEESRFHWIEAAVLLRQPDGAWKIDRLQSTPVSVEGAMAEGG